MLFADVWVSLLAWVALMGWADWAGTGGYSDAVVIRRVRIVFVAWVSIVLPYAVLRVFFFPAALAPLFGPS